jgi:anti-anti-sigma regulatory factor
VASNFKISIRKTNAVTHVKLRGDFDGTSACELLNVLEKRCDSEDHVFIDTDNLRQIYGFGRDTFQKNLRMLKGRCFHIVFRGKNAAQLAPG